ncbi:MAG TPA: cation diffusion facilitator family transporter [Terriglobia bacterium]|nr:cation diffusion facilitator family transporter [Terriglobia bacterium]
MHPHDIQAGAVLRASILLMLALAAAEAAAGYWTHSLALLSDAGHNFTDSLALLLAWFAFRWQSKPADEVKTYGYHRAGVLAAFVNGLALVALALFIFYEAYERFRNPLPLHTGWMMLVAGLGFVIDTGVSLALLRHARGDVNMRTAFVHTAADATSTAAIVLGGWAIQRTGWLQIDALLSFAIGGLILWSSVDIIRETLNILLEGLPRGLSLEKIVAAMQQVEGVQAVHDVHVWSLGSSTHALSSHVTIADIPPSESNDILRRLNQMLDERFHIHHTTIQFEHVECGVPAQCLSPEREAVHAGQPHQQERAQ